MKKLIMMMMLMSSTAMAGFIVLDHGKYEDPQLHDLEVKAENGDDAHTQVLIKLYGTEDELDAAWHSRGGEDSVYGFVDFDVEGYCRINTMRPDGWNDMGALSTLGHELLHCFGADHKGDKIYD